MKTPLKLILPVLMTLLLFSCGKKADTPREESRAAENPAAEIVTPVPDVPSAPLAEETPAEEPVLNEPAPAVALAEQTPIEESVIEETVSDVPPVKETLPVEPDVIETFPEVALIENAADTEGLPPRPEPVKEEQESLEIGQYAILPDDWKGFVTRSPESIDPLGKEPDNLKDEEPVLIAVEPPAEETSHTAKALSAVPEAEQKESPVVQVEESQKPVAPGESPVIVIAPPPAAEPQTEESPVEPVAAVIVEEFPQVLEGGPEIVLTHPGNQDYYMSSLLLEGECLPGEGLDDDKARVRTLTWKIPGMGDWSSPVFMEEDGSFQIDLVTSSLEGPQILILESEDFAGRISRQTIELQDGNQPPSIQLENDEEQRSYGALLTIRGHLDDPYAGIPELEGFSSLRYRLVSQDRSSNSKPLSGEISIDSTGEFFSSVSMTDRVGEQVLLLEVQGKNGSRSSRQIRLVPGTGDIPSFALEPQDGRLTFSWEEVPGALEQNLFISDNPESQPEENPTARFSSIHSPLVVDGTENGHLYKAKLEIVTANGSLWSEIIEGIPLAPGTLNLTAQGGFEQVKLSWKSIPGTEKFRIWRRSESEKDFTILVPEVSGQEYIDATASFGTTYFYRIDPAAVSGPLSFAVPASSVEAPSDKITLSSNYRQIVPEKISIQGDYAYVAAGDGGFHILDISTPQKPVSIGVLDQPGVKDVYIGTEYVYLASGSQGFQVVNIEEPTRPYTVLSRVTSDAVSIVGRDNLVYLADSRQGLQIFDITDRQNPERVSSFRDADIRQLELRDSLLYAATGEGGMILLDISNPYTPKVTASFTDFPVYDILLQDDRIYLACGSSGMVILQETDEGEWSELSRYPSDDARMIRLWEDYAMIADGRGGMKAVDISQPSDPRFFGSYTGTDVKALAMSDEYALLADVSGLKVVRTYLFGQSFVQNRWETPGRCYGVLSEGNRLWITDRQGGVSVYQSDSPANMKASSFIRNFPTEFAEDILIKDDVLYVADGPGGVKMFRLSDSSSEPFLNVAVNGRVRRVLPYGRQIALLSSEEGVVFMDETTADSEAGSSLTFSSRFYSSDPRDAVFSGTTLFLGDARDGLIVAEKVENQFFELERFGDYKEISQLILADRVLYVLHSRGISLLDVQNPESPRLLAFIPSTEAESMQMKGDLLYLAEGFRGVSVYRMGSDYQPQKVSVCEDVFAVDAAPRDNYVYTADMDGVSVIKVIVPDWK